MSRGAAGGGAIRGDTAAPQELSLDAVLYDRVGTDQARRTYYAAETADGYVVAEMPERGAAESAGRIPHDALPGLLEHVGERVGWADLEPAWQERAFGGEADGE